MIFIHNVTRRLEILNRFSETRGLDHEMRQDFWPKTRPTPMAFHPVTRSNAVVECFAAVPGQKQWYPKWRQIRKRRDVTRFRNRGY